jgi:predicted lysophospholipase L1 biosynthesis ABC-type transport system permease subunit
MALALAGLAIGAMGSLLATRLMRSLLFHVAPEDPWTLGIAAATLAVVSWLACYIPARRAAGVDPLVALRYEQDYSADLPRYCMSVTLNLCSNFTPCDWNWKVISFSSEMGKVLGKRNRMAIDPFRPSN